MKEDLTLLLQQLAEKIGTTTEMLWGVLLKQAAIDGILGAIFIVASVVISIVLITLLKRKLMDEEYEFLDESLDIVCVLVPVILIVVSAVLTRDVIACFVNPEYYALKEILNALK